MRCELKRSNSHVQGKAKLLYERRSVLRHGLVMDGVIWEIPRSERYPEGLRYRLALVEVQAGRVLVLFDNHYPKGHHRHWGDGSETPYHFRSLDLLMGDYLEAIRNEENTYEG